MSEEKHNEPWGEVAGDRWDQPARDFGIQPGGHSWDQAGGGSRKQTGGDDLEDRLNSLELIPGQEPLDKGAAWNRLHGRLGGKGYTDRYAKRYYWYRVAAACLLLAVLGGAGFWFLQKPGRGAGSAGRDSAGPAIVGRGPEDGSAVSNPATTADHKEMTNDKEAAGDKPRTVGKKNTIRRGPGRNGEPGRIRSASSATSFVKKAGTELDFSQTSLSQAILPEGRLPRSILPQAILPQGAFPQAKSPQGGLPTVSRGRAGGLPVVSLNEIPLRKEGVAANDTTQHSFKKKIYNPARLFLPALASEDPPLDPVVKIKLSAQN